MMLSITSSKANSLVWEPLCSASDLYIVPQITKIYAKIIKVVKIDNLKVIFKKSPN